MQVLDDNTLFIPDRPGSNRLDTMINTIENPNVGLIFLVPGFDGTLRVNGKVTSVRDGALAPAAVVNGREPKVGVKVEGREAFPHCAKEKAGSSSRTWSGGTMASGWKCEPYREQLMMSTFNRGLDDAFVDALNEEYGKNGWWRRFVDDTDIFLAIRGNYMNAYYCGCSLLKLSWKSGTIVGKIHYKYLLHPNIPDPYVEVVDGKANLPDDTKIWFLNDMSDIDNLKKAVKPYAGDEKIGIQDILDSNHNILDVEIAFGTGNGVPRLDFAALQNSSKGVKIFFFEAKHFDNKELRAEDEPKVIQQMGIYSCKLRENRDAVIDSYYRVCCNLRSLCGMAERYRKYHAMLESIADGSRKLDIEENPKLCVFGFDTDQRDGKCWQPHRDKLEKMLNGRVNFRGNSKGFVRGISA